jgi:hypothetical protein
MSFIKIEINKDDGTVQTHTINGNTEGELVAALYNFVLEFEKDKCVDAPVLPVITVVLPLGINQLDEQKLKARLAYLGIKDAGCAVLRLRCMHYTPRQIADMNGYHTIGAVNSQIYLIKKFLGNFTLEQLIDICTCEIVDYNIRYYNLIEDFKQLNDCRYKKQMPI